MFKNTIPILIAVALIVAGLFFKLWDLQFPHLLGYAIITGVAAYVGLMVGRRSDAANAYADEINRRIKAYEKKLRDAGLSTDL